MKQTLIKRCSFLLFMLMSILASAQSSSDVTITGTVTDDLGGLLPGVNVTEKSSKNTVTTGFDGQYKIKVKAGATLVFSYIGMKKAEVSLAGRTKLDYKMQSDSNQLEDIVVVAYGSQKKNNVTGAIVALKPDDFQDLPVSNLSEALRGLTPGVSVSGGATRPGEAATLQIRQTFGFSKDGNSNIPLVVIDDMVQIDPQNGKPTLDTFNQLDPSEIESITVLKDGSAAIYGSRASQGAVIVKTKRGKSGKTQFTYYSQYSFNDAVSHSKTMDAYEHGIWKNRFLNSNLDQNTANYFSPAELEQMKGLDYDWLKKAWKPATQQRQSLSASGGTEKATYFAGITYFDQGPNLGEQDYKKWNFRTGTTIKISQDLVFSASISAITTDVTKSYSKASANLNDSSFGSLAGGEQADYAYLLHMPKYIPWETTLNGNTYWMSPFPRTDRNLGSANSNTTIAGWNYFAGLDAGKQTEEQFSYNVNLSLEYKLPFVKGLSVKGSFARSQSSSYTEQYQLPYDLLRISNHHTQDNHLLNPNSIFANNGAPETNIRGSRAYYTTDLDKVIQGNFFATYARTFGNHNVSAMVGYEQSEAWNKQVRLAYEGTSKDFLGNSTTAGPISTNSQAVKVESGTQSYLGRVNYSFKDRYLVEFIFRSDASTKFAPQNYWGSFPGAQLGWVMSKEDWFTDNVSWVNNLKLRYSIGKTGKDNIDYWRWLQFYEPLPDKGAQFGSNGGLLGGGITPRPNPNENVHWDTTIKNNIGIDLAFLRNRLQVSADYYYDKTTDALIGLAGEAGTPITVGGGFAEVNYAAIDAWGTEFSLNWSDKIKDFSYNVGVNFAFSDNEVKKYPNLARTDANTNITEVGSSTFFPTWGFKTWKETSTGDGILRTDQDVTNYWNYLTERATAAGVLPTYMGINNVTAMRKGMLAYEDTAGVYNASEGTQAGADGRIMRNEDYVKLAKNNRTYGFTSNLGFRYKTFYFRTQIQTSWGGYRTIDLVKQGTASAHNDWAHESFWTDMYDATDNPNGKYPNMGQQDYIFAPSDFWQLDTFRCVIRNMTVGFELPREAMKQLNIQKATLGVTGNNLWDLYNPYPDHYRNMYDDSASRYPTLRTWSINLNVSF
ncbi:SusC/RagA family TonB-linked outer membrane protein [Flavobacterium sp. MDT1-60]|uniref:SusC/RagA family TonB-linked outer membrane protein n=1 Tax=Flavobacterium sp. MDT1-60 TaxID=1979344 RepID=UPI001781A7AF|nr:SusC/RagA family TonB-linked outer membrane protein [Flavobacterium sp. MDT1-60]QOG03626.1 SusC/RagA family TonB-linked outer membrane protein [Flavobacterium sp. MDT1-60]